MAYASQAEKDRLHDELRAAQAANDQNRIAAATKAITDANARPVSTSLPVAN